MIKEILKNIWSELDTVLELFTYLGIALAISKIFPLTFVQSLVVILIYFIINIVRLIVSRPR